MLNETLVRDQRVCCWEICEINPLLDVVNTTVENSLAVFQAVVGTVVRRLGTELGARVSIRRKQSPAVDLLVLYENADFVVYALDGRAR